MPKLGRRKGITNIEELRDELVGAFEMVQDDPLTAPEAGELANLAGKIIGTAKLQLTYADLKKEKPSIAFLDAEK